MFNDTTHALADSRYPSSVDPRPTDETLLTRFNAHFSSITADTDAHVKAAQMIRYQVYCVENPLENIKNPDRIETDAFDDHSVHSLLVYRAAEAALGTVRLILPLEDNLEASFAFRRVLSASAWREFQKLPLHSAAEVSRFSISRQFRRVLDSAARDEQTFLSNSGPLMRLGLIQGLVRMSVQHGVTHWCAIMEPTLMRMLAAMSIRFRPVGPPVEFHGMRQPCYCKLADILEAVRIERPAFWSVLTDGGSLTAGAGVA